MQYFKKLPAVALLIVLLIASTSLSFAQDAESIRFGILAGPPVEPVANLMVEGFNAIHPDIEVELEFLSGDLAAGYAAQAAAGTLPDVIFTADLFVVPFVQGDIVLDMQPLADADDSFDLDDVYANMLDLSRVGGEGLYMIPSAFDVVTMYVNKTMFEETGAPTPEADWTWEQLIDSCKIVQENSDNWCMQMNWDWWAQYVPWIVGYGGSLMGEDGRTSMLSSEETLAGLNAYTSLWTEHGVAMPIDFDAGGPCFVVGKCAVTFHIPGAYLGTLRALDPQPFDWDVEVIPTLPEGKVTGMGTFGFAISSNAADPDLAWDLIKGLLSAETQLAIAESYAGVPLLRSLREDPAIQGLAGPPDNLVAFIENGENGITPTYYPGECGSLYAGQINQEIKDAMEASILGVMSAEEAFSFANDNIQDCLDRTIDD
jgi:multiple sugar transport system substrate-binding protein